MVDFEIRAAIPAHERSIALTDFAFSACPCQNFRDDIGVAHEDLRRDGNGRWLSGREGQPAAPGLPRI